MSAPPSIPRRPISLFFYENGLSIILLSAFVLLAIANTLAGLHHTNHERRQDNLPDLTYFGFLQSGACWESLSENWESEFLEMAAFVALSAMFFQLGSPESKDPYHPDPPSKPRPDSPWPARAGGFTRTLYGCSLSIAFFLLFLGAFVIHAIAGAAEYNTQQQIQGESPLRVWQFMLTSSFWFQSLQNWQSEFLGIGAMILLSIWLRQKGSPESKEVDSPHRAHH